MNTKFPCIDCIILPICKNQQSRDHIDYLRRLLRKCSLLRKFIIKDGNDASYYQEINFKSYITLAEFFNLEYKEDPQKSLYILRSW